MKAIALVLAPVLALAGCGIGSRDAAEPNPNGPGSGSGTGFGCAVSLGYTPASPVAGPSTTLHVSSHVSVPLVGLHYAWQVRFNGAVVSPTLSDSAAIDVPAPTAGVYAVSLQVSGVSPACPQAAVSINAAAPGALTQTVRLRVVPPRGVAAPLMEKLLPINGGADADLGIIGIDSGVLASPFVMGPSGSVPAYLQFSPAGAPDAIVEGFSDASGAAAVQLVLGPYAVLVVPSAGGAAPRRIAGWSPGAVLRVDAGSLIQGTVATPDGPVPGATVRLVIDGVPSTVATTATPDGSFALRAATGGTTTVEVTPPAGSGLPRLLATSSSFDLTMPLQIQYAANVSLVDLAGTTVQRLGAPAAGARLTVVGSLATAGTVIAGAVTAVTPVVATGEVRIAAAADAGGALPATRVPAVPLSAVVEVAPGDLAVVALDTSAGAPATLDAPAGRLITTAALDDRGAGLPGAVLELVPTGALAMAGAPTLRIPAGPAGAIVATLPSGGHYDLRFADPMGRRAPLVVPAREVTPPPAMPQAGIAPSYMLPAAVQLHGTLRLDGGQALANASVQILCQACTGIERTRPLVEVASDAAGQFTLAVPDPGTR